MNTPKARIRKATRTRARIKRLGEMRLCVNRSSQHIYAQVIAPNGSEVIASASTVDKEFKAKKIAGSNIDAAKVIGTLVAEKAVKAGVKKVAFDRSGFNYHGRVKALADAAREGGLEF